MVKPLIDVSSLNLSQPVAGPADIRAQNPHRHEFELLDAILQYGPEGAVSVAVHRVREDAFWARGHIPGRPLMPGVLQLEAAAQLCSYMYYREMGKENGFFGFAGVDKVRFRQVVAPPADLYLLASFDVLRPYAAKFDVQGVVDGEVAMAACITGMIIKGF